MGLAPRKTNTEALEVFSGQLPIEPITPTTEPKILRVMTTKFAEASTIFMFMIEFDQRVDGLEMRDIAVTAPAQLISWLQNGRLTRDGIHFGERGHSVVLEYDIHEDFDVSQLPDDYTLSISIRAGSIQGEGS